MITLDEWAEIRRIAISAGTALHPGGLVLIAVGIAVTSGIL